MLQAIGAAVVARSRQTRRALCGMCARSWDTMVCINIQGMLAVVPWMPVMPERWRGDESAK
jgi:hypothetical protein